MQNQLSGAIIRLHGPLSLHLWDRGIRLVAMALMALGLALYLLHDARPATVAFAGGLALTVQSTYERRRYSRAAWATAARGADPVLTLCLFEHLRRLRWRDLLVVAEWHARQEAEGVSRWDADDPTIPSQVRAIWEHVGCVPREE